MLILLMNPFLNPIISFPILKDYLSDRKRLKKYSPEKMEKYRNKQFKKIIKYAYTVPLYHKKYKEAGINPQDVKKIDDITKLPFISKKDLIDNFPYNILPVNSKPSATISAIAANADIYLHFNAMVDLSKEQDKIRKNLVAEKQRLEGKKKLIANPNFVKKAQGEIVQSIKNDIIEIENKIKRLDKLRNDLI